MPRTHTTPIRKPGTTNPAGRRVTANLSLTLDGRYNGPGGTGDFAAFAPYVISEVAIAVLLRPGSAERAGQRAVPGTRSRSTASRRRRSGRRS
ncbi:hypothetical protein FLW16_10930 [Microbispora sp. KK1-11]|nr:hypothetical protein FLW16_10930 [Microbispora sp. KK1-11]